MGELKVICEGLPPWGHYCVWVAIFVWEFWLGRTGKLKAGSTLELIYNLVKKAIGKGE